MIPQSKLLPPLSAKDRDAFLQLVADYDAGKAQVSKFGGDARVARKKELRAKLKTAKGEDLLKAGAELQTLDESFTHARRGAKLQLKNLNVRYCELFPQLIDRADAHVDKLIKEVNAEYSKHFAAFDVQPVGQSPMLAPLLTWKKQLDMKRSGLSVFADRSATPLRPTDILPYAVEPTGEELV